MKDRIKLSIITPCLNAQSVIEETVKSVLKQTYMDYEYIIVDGASRDRTISIIKEYAPAFQGRMQWTSEKDFGIYNAMNRGIARASGDYVIFMNAGDSFYDRDVLKRVTEQIKKNGTQGIYFGKAWINSGFGKSRIYNFTKCNNSYIVPILNGFMPCHQSIFAPLEVLRYTYFNEKYKIRADFDWVVKSYRLGIKFISLDDVVCNYAGGGISERHKGQFMKETDEILRKNFSVLYAIKKLKDFFVFD